ncbi:MAG: VapC toxin family PIN domain ribonuclease [Burkholderiaceae bacterium]|nr:VapC toxin family PIN domain ribonuclease [Roseateles sp.]MBV8469219.1 VapC toxin family PIN domain ribonuclease [Burkholderiaceae bacterium]
MRSLLDVNVLLALLDASHIHHMLAISWWKQHHRQGWASCPLTQNAVVRIMSSPGYQQRQPPAMVAERLALATSHVDHEFWPDSLSLLEPGLLKWDRVTGTRQVSDIYLVALAVKNGGRLVTLDQGISVHAVRGASSKHLLTLL